jgi:hypothetical protein
MLSKHEQQLERLEHLENEKRLRDQTGTFFSHTHNDTGGRFSAVSASHVVGSESIPKYPAAYHQVDPVPDEPPLGYSISDHEPTGEKHELRASVGSLPTPEPHLSARATADPSSPLAGMAGDLTTPPSVRSPSFSTRTFRRA